MSDRVLHERVRGDNEVAREPRPREQSHGHREVPKPPESLLAEEEEPEERGYENEGEHPFDSKGLADDLPCVPREVGPVRPELEFKRGIPVTTPMAKFSAKIRVQNRADFVAPACRPLAAREP